VLLRVVVALVSGVALSLAYQPVGIGWLVPLGVAGYVLTTSGLRVRGAWAPGLAFGIGFQFTLLWWMRAVGYDAWAALAGLEAVFYGLLGVGMPLLRRLPLWPLWFAVAWTAMEEWRSYSPFSGMPWGRLSYATADTAWAQALPWIGFTGLSALLALLGCLLALVLAEARRRHGVPLGALAALVAAVAVSVLPVLVPYTVATHGAVTVAAVQGNVPGDGSDVLVDVRRLTQNHTDATVRLAADVGAGRVPRPDFVVWPENSTATDPFADPIAHSQVEEAVHAVGVPILVGGMVDVGTDRILNQGIVWDPDTGPGDRYSKHHPVPFGEYVPWRSVFAGNLARLQRVPRDMMAGTRVTPLTIAGVPVADAICFDIGYDDGINDQVTRGGQLLVVQTSNATFVHTDQLEQQFDITRLRALETGRTTIVASTDGVSGIIAPDGTVTDRAAIRTQDVLVRRVALSTDLTPGLRFDGWGGRGAEAVTVVGLLLGLLPYRRGRRPRGRSSDPQPGHDDRRERGEQWQLSDA
jgi:apolipoprotein N-acyltransferase